MSLQLPKAFISHYAEMLLGFKLAEHRGTEMEEKPGSFQQEFEHLLYFILGMQRIQCETLFNI